MNKKTPNNRSNSNNRNQGEAKNSSNKPTPTILRVDTKPPPSPKK